jgi:hypothetical protein
MSFSEALDTIAIASNKVRSDKSSIIACQSLGTLLENTSLIPVMNAFLATAHG